MQIPTTIAQGQTESDPYLAAFESAARTPGLPSWLYPVRKSALARYAEFGFPTLEQEDWRFTNLEPIKKLPFIPVTSPGSTKISEQTLVPFLIPGLKCIRLVFLNGHFLPELSQVPALPKGMQIGNLAAALHKDSSLVREHLVQSAQNDQNAFAALNTAYFQDGAWVYVPSSQTSDPVHLIFLQDSQEPGSTTHVRNLIVAARDAKCTVIETYAGLNDAACVTNSVTDLHIGDGAVVEHVKVQDENPNAYHVACLPNRLGASANFIMHSIALGARLSRNNIYTFLDGENAECILNGLYHTRHDQLTDHWMRVEHVRPHCNSHEYFNGILEDRSRGVFHGRILVQPQAQKTDAKQTNKNLLLSDTATVNTKPQLEIYADDVKCTHGATVGQLDEDSIFYLRARGIGRETARSMLIHAFAGEIIDRIRCPEVREVLSSRLWERLEQNQGMGKKS